MDTELVKYVIPMGVGGVLAAFIFVAYRKDSLQWQGAWKGQADILMQVVKENTAAITALVSRLQRDDR